MLTHPQQLMNKKQDNYQNKSQQTVLITYLPVLTASKCNTLMFLFCIFCICTSAIATSSHDNQNQFNVLASFAQQHARQNSLIEVNIQNKQQLNDGTLIYFYTSVEYAQICYQKNQNISFLPEHLIYRSYSPIQPASSEISCYQLQKPFLVETPSVEVPIVDLSDADQNRKYKKQTQYLINQYNLLKWIYNFGTSIEKQLGNMKHNSKSMSLHNLDAFSTLLHCNGDGTNSFLKIWKRNDTLTSGSFKVYKKLAGKGLHQEVTYTINIDNNDKKIPKVTYDINGEECYVSILQTLPHTIYVDVDELKSRGYQVDLERGQFRDGVGYINVQKPAYQSRQYQYKLKIPWNAWNNTHGNQYQLKTPIHFRYPTPYFLQKLQQDKQKEIQYVQVDLQPITKAEIICREQSDKDVYQLKEDHLVTRGSAFMPVGDGEMKSVVNIITLGSSIMCAVLLVRRLRK